MMKKMGITFWLLAAVAILALVLGLGWFGARVSASQEAMPGPLASLKQHFQARGLQPRATLVRFIGVNEAKSQARFWLQGTGDKPIYVYWCKSAQEAQTVMERMRKTSPTTPIATRGELVLYLSAWPAGDPDAGKVLAAFESWPG
jgi:hypothetical protein